MNLLAVILWEYLDYLIVISVCNVYTCMVSFLHSLITNYRQPHSIIYVLVVLSYLHTKVYTNYKIWPKVTINPIPKNECLHFFLLIEKMSVYIDTEKWYAISFHFFKTRVQVNYEIFFMSCLTLKPHLQVLPKLEWLWN